MARALKACAKHACPNLTRTTYCTEHEQPAWSGSTRSARLPNDWARRRRAVLKRDGWLCRIKGPRCTLVASEVDHVEHGDDHELTNLQAVCGACHKAKTASESAAARRSTP